MDKLLFVRHEIKQLAAAAADVLARDRAQHAKAADRLDVWGDALDTLAAGLAAPALGALDDVAVMVAQIEAPTAGRGAA